MWLSSDQKSSQTGKILIEALVRGAQDLHRGIAFPATEETIAHDLHNHFAVKASPDRADLTDAFAFNRPKSHRLRFLPMRFQTAWAANSSPTPVRLPSPSGVAYLCGGMYLADQ